MYTLEQERGLNHIAYYRLKSELAETHKGKFIAIVRGEQAADSDTIEELLQQLNSIELSPQRRFIFQVGEEYPEKVTIFMKGRD